MKPTLILVVSGLFFAVSLAAAAPPDRPAAGLTPEQIVRARQAAYGLSAATFGEMKIAIDSGGDVKPLVFGSTMLTRWARTLTTLFPGGSNVPPTNARAEVWKNRAGFNERAGAYAAAAAKLGDAAKAGDKAAFADQWNVVRDTCKACHDSFRNTNAAGRPN